MMQKLADFCDFVSVYQKMIHIANYETLNIDPVSDLISTGTHCHSPYAKDLETSPG